jgi:hypothetical protein
MIYQVSRLIHLFSLTLNNHPLDLTIEIIFFVILIFHIKGIFSRYFLFFVLYYWDLSCEPVTFTDGDYRWCFTIMLCHYTTNLISTIKSPICPIWRSVFLPQLSSASCPCDETGVLPRVAYCCWPNIHWRCVLCCESFSLVIYHHMLNSNQQVQLRTFRQINVQADRTLTN